MSNDFCSFSKKLCGIWPPLYIMCTYGMFKWERSGGIKLSRDYYLYIQHKCSAHHNILHLIIFYSFKYTKYFCVCLIHLSYPPFCQYNFSYLCETEMWRIYWNYDDFWHSKRNYKVTWLLAFPILLQSISMFIRCTLKIWR